MPTTSILKSLNLAVSPVIKNNVIAHKRQKLIDNLLIQLQLVDAKIKGTQFQPMRDKLVDDGNGGKKTVQVPHRVKRWFIFEGSKVFFQVRYSNKPLELAKGKTSIEAKSQNEIPLIIKKVIDAINDGELDSLLMAVKRRRRRSE